MNNTWSRHAYGMVRLKPSANTNVFYISLFIKYVYRVLPPLLEYPWPHFKRQLTASHSFCYHGHLGRPHTGGAPTPLCESTNSRTHFHRNWYCTIKKQKTVQLLEFPFISDNDNVHFTWTPTSFSAHAHLPCTARRYRTSPQRLCGSHSWSVRMRSSIVPGM